MVLPSRVCFCLRLRVIINYGSSFVIYGNEIESIGVQFPAEVPLMKLIGGANFQSPVRDSWKISALVPLYQPRLKFFNLNVILTCNTDIKKSNYQPKIERVKGTFLFL